jgi:hypothetical protein
MGNFRLCVVFLLGRRKRKKKKIIIIIILELYLMMCEIHVFEEGSKFSGGIIVVVV